MVRCRKVSPVATENPKGFESSRVGWRRGWDLNPRSPCEDARFRGESIRPLWHLSWQLAELGGTERRAPLNDQAIEGAYSERRDISMSFLSVGGAIKP